MIRMMQVNDVNDVNATAVPAGCWNAALVALVAQVAQADPLGTHLVAEEFHVPTGAKEPLRLAESSFGRQPPGSARSASTSPGPEGPKMASQ